MPRLRHDPVTQSLHWTIAAAVLATYLLGLVREDVPDGAPRALVFGLHMSFGLLVLMLSVVRIGWRLGAPTPVPVAMASAMRIAAAAGHGALLVALIVLPTLGILAVWADGHALTFFGLIEIASPLAPSETLAETLEDLHGAFAHAVLILAGLHAAAALAHQYVLKDGVLGRMVPFVAAPPPPSAD